jgi:hypothetical protein
MNYSHTSIREGADMNEERNAAPTVAGSRARRLAVLVCLAALCGACGVSPGLEYPVVKGQRAPGMTLTPHSVVPYRVGAYELVFADQPDAPHARRAALLVSLLDGHGHVEGFAEWGQSGEPPKTYAVGGWARQRSVGDQVTTVLELRLERLDAPAIVSAAGDPGALRSLAVRVVVDETSGNATLTRRQ